MQVLSTVNTSLMRFFISRELVYVFRGDVKNPSPDDKIQYYTALNRFGRERFRSGTVSPATLMDFLAHCVVREGEGEECVFNTCFGLLLEMDHAFWP